MSLQQRLIEDQRGIVLRALDEDSGYRLAEASLRRVLDLHGHLISRDELRAQLEWLERGGLVRVDREPVAGGTMWMMQLLDAGQVVARGRSYPGVARASYAPGG